ncbi:MAG TPA: tellurite resistance/C4-dicarboxylate transporter family protein [Pyrinomonadaceae bacterium]|nr:tellurite resistance/C4-dicarboxylate transporter family protein [Pyrinomonadaceae bacterium]
MTTTREARTNEAANGGAFSRAAAGLFPGYFALVMATGIVSIAAYLLALTVVAWALVFVNVAAYAILWALLAVRLVRFFPRVRADLNDHARGPGFFTVVAGTCVLGSQLLIVAGRDGVALALWLAGALLWAVVMYAFFTFITVREEKPTLESGLNGTWLLATVATQSVSVLGTLLAGSFGAYRETLLFLTLCMFLLGCMLYLLLITFIFYRFTFVNFTPILLTPPYWINMGAVAITTLAGARLIIAAPSWGLLADLLPFLKGFTLFFWAAGTWWIPLLFVLGFWRHVQKRFPLRYDPQYWGMVFPLGMYTVCTFQLSKAIGFEPLMLVPRCFVYLALAAWLAAFAGLAQTLLFKRADG